MTIRFTVPGEPRPSRRRSTVINGRAMRYQTKESKLAQQTVQQFAWAAMNGEPPLDGPVVVRLDVYRAKGRPASKQGKAKAEARQIRPITRPDCNNYGKLIEDGLNGICFVDDAQVVELVVAKWYSATPRIEVTVTPWEAPCAE